jgi:hypothetical protein
MSSLVREPEEKRREKERLQGMKREPFKERVKWVSAETTDAEEREGMKKTEGREEGNGVIIQDDDE